VKEPRLTETKLWFAFSMIGFSVAIIYFCMILLEDFLIEVKGEILQYLTIGSTLRPISAMSFYITVSLVLACSAGMMTVYIAPKASGSGIPELMGCLNGIRISQYLTPTVLMVKAIAVVLAIAGTLVVGKEGPLAHIGAAVAISLLFAPI